MPGKTMTYNKRQEQAIRDEHGTITMQSWNSRYFGDNDKRAGSRIVTIQQSEPKPLK